MSKSICSITRLFTYLAFVIASQVFGREADTTLCAAFEHIYFSCPLSGGKIVSVCAFDNKNPGVGYVQYRYGLPGKVEMVYPQEKAPPKGKLFFVNASEGSVNKDIIKFRKGSYTYLVAQASISYLTVLKSDEVVLRKYCYGGGNAFVSRAARQGVESVPKSPEDFR